MPREKEKLCDGLLDGMEVETQKDTLVLIYGGQVYTYCRYADGRLYLNGSNWDKNGGHR